MPAASRAEEEIKSAYNDADISLELGSGGDFIVEVDGKIIYSKNDLIGNNLNRFPHNGELLTLLRNAGY